MKKIKFIIFTFIGIYSNAYILKVSNLYNFLKTANLTTCDDYNNMSESKKNNYQENYNNLLILVLEEFESNDIIIQKEIQNLEDLNNQDINYNHAIILNDKYRVMDNIKKYCTFNEKLKINKNIQNFEKTQNIFEMIFTAFKNKIIIFENLIKILNYKVNETKNVIDQNQIIVNFI